jgi:hypothetical protein
MERMEPEAIMQLRAQLEPLGLYKYASDEDIRWSIEDSMQTGRWYSEGTERMTWGDAEAIAERGACNFLTRISPMLERYGVPPLECEQDEPPTEPKEYRITLNGREWLIFPEGDPDWEPLWASAPARTFAIVERLLREAGSDVHIYTPRGEIAQESSAIFLTEEMYNVVNNSPLVPDEQKLLTTQEMLDMIWPRGNDQDTD